MLKRITVVLVGLFATLGLVATPAANGSDTDLVGEVRLFELQDRNESGANVSVLEAEIPTSCSPIPAELESVRSAENNTASPGTGISFFTNSNCTMGEEPIEPDAFDDEINLPQGALFWRATQ